MLKSEVTLRMPCDAIGVMPLTVVKEDAISCTPHLERKQNIIDSKR